MFNRFLQKPESVYLAPGAEAIFADTRQRLAIAADHLFAALFLFQWMLGLVFAFTFSPNSWAGANSQIHFHVYAAIFLGGALAFYPAFLCYTQAGRVRTRFIAAVAQMGFSALFIHLTGGRIETHFHIFGSLAFLAFYRDLRVLAIASFVTAADHFVMGSLSPLNIYGTLTSTPWRAMEHTLWVLFEDAFLGLSIYGAINEMKVSAKNQFELSITLGTVEKLSAERAAELVLSKETILEQQRTMTSIEGRSETLGLLLIQTISERALAYRESRLKGYGIKVSMDLPAHRLFVNCRANELIQAFVHLLDHAIDSKSPVGERELLIRVRPKGAQLEIVIEGTGGEWRGSTDLDYSIAFNCVQSHSGDLKLEAQDNRLRFVMTLPNALASDQKTIGVA